MRVFTTRPDTGFGVTYAVLAPEHPLVERLTTPARREDVGALVARARSASEVERMASFEDDAAASKRGAFTGSSSSTPSTAARCRLRRGLRPHGLRHRGDHGRAGRGRAGLRLRDGARARRGAHGRGAGRLRRGDERCVDRGRGEGQLGLPRRPRRPHRDRRGDAVRGARGPRHGDGQLPAPRLARLAAAVLGLSHPDRVLPGLRRGPRAGRPAPGRRA